MTIQPNEANRVPQWTLQDGLRKAREFAGFEQGELADRMEMSRATVSNYERGVARPKRSTVIAWAFACGVEAEWLLMLPHLDSNQEPSGYLPAFFPAIAGIFESAGQGSTGSWSESTSGSVIDLAAYRERVSA